MIRGKVRISAAEAEIVLLQPVITISIAGADHAFQMEEAIVDTGFTGWLTLPKHIIEDLRLTCYGQRRAVLANGEPIASEVYSALVSWHGRIRPALVYQLDGKPLIGMALLSGSRLIADAWDGGDVIIEEVMQ